MIRVNRTKLPLSEKQSILRELQIDTQEKVATRHQITQQAVSYLVSKRDFYMSSDCSESVTKVVRQKYEELENKLCQFIRECNYKHIPVNGPIIKAKALKLSTDENFKASNGWLNNFLHRKRLSLKKYSGESKSVDINLVASERRKIIDIMIDYRSRDIYNSDETGLQ